MMVDDTAGHTPLEAHTLSRGDWLAAAQHEAAVQRKLVEIKAAELTHQRKLNQDLDAATIQLAECHAKVTDLLITAYDRQQMLELHLGTAHERIRALEIENGCLMERVRTLEAAAARGNVPEWALAIGG